MTWVIRLTLRKIRSEIMKIRFITLLTLLVLIIIPTHIVFADVFLEEGSKCIKEDSIYEEKGQIVFKESDILKIRDNYRNFNRYNVNYNDELAELLSDSNFKDALYEYMTEDRTPVAVGWSRVYFKNLDTGKSSLMTKSDYNGISFEKNGNGKATLKGNLTLYTFAGYDNYNPKLLYGDSIAIWNGGEIGSNGPDNDNDDFITITWPAGHVLLSSGLIGGNNSYKKDEGYTSVVWAAKEKKGTMRLQTTGRNDSGISTKKWVSKYVHTWTKTVPSFNISATDVGITLADKDASWQIASSVVL